MKNVAMNFQKYNKLRNKLIFSEWKDRVKIVLDLLGFIPEVVIFPANCIYIENEKNIVKIFPQSVLWEEK